MKINILALDHNKSGLQFLFDCFSGLPDYNLLPVVSNLKEGINMLSATTRIDLLLVNMEMPGLKDLAFIKPWRSKIKKIIVFSTHEKHAIDAFEIEANAFLLSPFSDSKLMDTLNKLFPSEPAAKQRLLIQEDFFFIKSKNEKFNLIKIRPEEIIYVESLQNYIAIQTTSKKVIAHLTLTKIREILKDQDHIIQVHRSFLVSKKYIEEVESNTVKMYGNTSITVGGDYRNELLAYIKRMTIQTGRMAMLTENKKERHTA